MNMNLKLSLIYRQSFDLITDYSKTILNTFSSLNVNDGNDGNVHFTLLCDYEQNSDT